MLPLTISILGTKLQPVPSVPGEPGRGGDACEPGIEHTINRADLSVYGCHAPHTFKAVLADAGVGALRAIDAGGALYGKRPAVEEL